MFLSVFATLSALMGVYSINNSNNAHDLNHFVRVEKAYLDDEGSQVGNISLVGGATTRQTSSNMFNYVTPTITQGEVTSWKFLRYYVISQQSVECGYIDFYCNIIAPTQSDNNTYYIPTIETHFEETFNLKFNITWNITNSDFPSLPLVHNYSLDLSLESNINSSYTADKSTLVTSAYISKLTYDFTIMSSPMSQDEYSSASLNYQEGYDKGFKDGYDDGYDIGYSQGASSVQVMDPQMFTIFNGILNVAMVPVNVFLGFFNWEVFGINIASMVSALLSVAVLIIVIRLIAGSAAKGN